MRDRLSFYVDRSSILHRSNPLTKLCLAFTLVIVAFFGPGLLLPGSVYLLVLVPLSLVGKVWREFSVVSARLLLPVVGFLFIMQSLFYPGGKTELFNLWFIKVELESVQYAFLMVTRILVMVSSFLLLLLTTHPSALMSDLTRRGLPGGIAYVISSTLQIIPQMQAKAGTIIDAQRSRGLDTQGSLGKRVGALLPLVGPLVFGSLVDVEERAIAIEARGFNSPLPKTSLVEIGDTSIEKITRWFFLLISITAIGSRIWIH
jgi:energy-coupling factor transport system permease protein